MRWLREFYARILNQIGREGVVLIYSFVVFGLFLATIIWIFTNLRTAYDLIIAGIVIFLGIVLFSGIVTLVDSFVPKRKEKEKVDDPDDTQPLGGGFHRERPNAVRRRPTDTSTRYRS